MILTTKQKNTIIKTSTVVLVDLSNVLYVLMNHYKYKEPVINKMREFLLKCLKHNKYVIIVSKSTIGINVIDILNYKNPSDFNKYIRSSQLSIYNLEYHQPNASNMDDLLYNLLLVDVFQNKCTSKCNVVYLTNDKQKFNKNLFGLYEGELLTNLSIQKVKYNSLTEYYTYSVHPQERSIINMLKEVATVNTTDTNNLECMIKNIIPLYSTKSISKTSGKSNSENITYKKINSLYRTKYSKTSKRENGKRCDMSHFTKKGNLEKTYFLYAYIKYIQSKLHNGNLYGSMSTENIIKMFK